MAVVDHLETLSGDVVGIPSVLPLKRTCPAGLKKSPFFLLLFCFAISAAALCVCARPSGRMTLLLVDSNQFVFLADD